MAVGLTYEGATCLLLGLVARDSKIIGFDLVEVSPGKHSTSSAKASAVKEWDANVGARLLWHLCGVLAN